MNNSRRYFPWILFAPVLALAVSWAPRGHADAPSGRYTTTTDTVTDTKTLLTWQRATAPGTYTWSGAQMYCTGLNLNGTTGWRMPSLKELQTIVDEQRKTTAIDPTVFPSPQYVFWTSTPLAGFTSTKAWSVNFAYGDSSAGDMTVPHYVRCVR